MDPTLVFGGLTAAVGGLWAYMLKERNDRLAEKNQQIADLKSELASLRQRTDTFDQILSRNIDSLSQSADAIQTLAEIMRQGKIRMPSEPSNSPGDRMTLPSG